MSIEDNSPASRSQGHSPRRAPRLAWRCRDRVLRFEGRPLVMGILNVTPDSFSDGSKFFDGSLAVRRGLEMFEQGADIVDVGGESTRPGAEEVPADEEARRVVPVIRALADQGSGLVSADTMKAAVARAALEAGARIINDVSALTHDPDMPRVAAESGAGVVLMHMQGTPRTMQASPRYGDVVAEVKAFLAGRVAAARAAGVARERIAVDPGIGFGKTAEHNLALLANLDALAGPDLPVVAGLSRKSFIGKLTGAAVEDRLAGTLGGAVYCALNGAHVLRVHDVREVLHAVTVALSIAGARS